MPEEETRSCPYCGNTCWADWCDVGVPGALVQCGPFHCEACGASEIGPYDAERPLNEMEKASGWYAPGSEPGSSANVIGGKVVTASRMKQVYQAEFRGNPLWHDKGYVESWWKKTRGT